MVSFDLSKYRFVDEMDVVAGMDSRDSANANGRIVIIEGRELKYLLKEHLARTDSHPRDPRSLTGLPGARGGLLVGRWTSLHR